MSLGVLRGSINTTKAIAYPVVPCLQTLIPAQVREEKDISYPALACFQPLIVAYLREEKLGGGSRETI